VANRDHRAIGVVEDDMADVAQADHALLDLEGLMLKLCQRPIVTLDDMDRLSGGLRDIRLGLGSIRKHLGRIREENTREPV